MIGHRVKGKGDGADKRWQRKSNAVRLRHGKLGGHTRKSHTHPHTALDVAPAGASRLTVMKTDNLITATSTHTTAYIQMVVPSIPLSLTDDHDEIA